MWIWIANKFANFHAKDLIEVKIFQKVSGGGLHFWNTIVSRENSPLTILSDLANRQIRQSNQPRNKYNRGEDITFLAEIGS